MEKPTYPLAVSMEREELWEYFILKLGMESSNGSAMAREEQDGGGGCAEEWRRCQAMLHPRPENKEGPRDTPKGPEPAAAELARPETRKSDCLSKEQLKSWLPLKQLAELQMTAKSSVEVVLIVF
ncbi:UNVERIFIED_CONTAM: hypothetical protein K2H54_031769 [Gekko kuhli]